MTDHSTGAQAVDARPEIERDASGRPVNPRYVALPDGSLFDIAECHGLTPGERPRCDGWTADRQRRFLIALSRGLTVDRACAIVEMSRTAAYTFRASARGAAFALGWEAAQVRARDVLADELMNRALNGVQKHVTSHDGRITTRKRHDNRLAFSLLTRLDRACDPTKAAPRQHAAALAAQDFEHYLDLLDETGTSGGPARAGLFLAARIEATADPAAAAQELEPVRALARADRWLRTHAHEADGDGQAPAPDPAARAEWTAADWARAEALGLIAIAPENDVSCQPCQLVQESPEDLDTPWVADDNPDAQPVWYCSVDEAWRTNFAPPTDFLGIEYGEWGDPGYSRSLDYDEIPVVEAAITAQTPLPTARDHQTRERWFAALSDEIHAPLSATDTEMAEPITAPPPPDDAKMIGSAPSATDSPLPDGGTLAISADPGYTDDIVDTVPRAPPFSADD